MKTENLTIAVHSFAFFESELMKAHADAINAGNQFAVIALFALIEQAASLRVNLRTIEIAAGID